MSVNGGPNGIESGLVFSLDAADKTSYSGGTTWYDLVGNNNGTLTNGPTFTSVNGGSLVFDGVDDYVLVNNGLYTLTGGTLNVWVKRTGTSSFFIGSYGGSGEQRSPTFYNNNGYVSWEFANFATAQQLTPFDANKWYNMVFTYNSSFNVVVYVNGLVVDTKTTSNPGGFWNQFTIGRYGNYGSSFLTGNISIVQVYNRPLSASEVLQNYNVTKSRFGL
jgi:hypothetical protein